MSVITALLATENDFAGWRAWARKLLHDGRSAKDIAWDIQPPETLYAAQAARTLPSSPSPFSLSQELAALFPAVIASADPKRFSLLYALLEHIKHHGPPPGDLPLLKTLHDLAERTKREALALREAFPQALVDGCPVLRTDARAPILESQARAFTALRPQPWLVVSPDRTLLWNGRTLSFGPAPRDVHAPDSVLLEEARRIARAGPQNDYWASIIPVRLSPTAEAIVKAPSLPTLRALAADCTFCPLCKPASRTVYGEGNTEATLLFVGEQPGDQEDRLGRPFVGPAGKLFDTALAEAGGRRDLAWVTNGVKHFRFEERWGRRIHQKPDPVHLHACAPWLAAERRLLRPQVTVMLGVTGATAVLGRPITVSRERSRLFPLEDGSTGLVTVHPSYLLRLPDEEAKAREYARFVADLRLALSALAEKADLG